MAHLGIDLGTSNTIISYYDDQLKGCLFNGKEYVPSFVYIDEEQDKLVIGAIAKTRWRSKGDLNKVFYKYKLKMGSKFLYAQKYSPEFLTSKMLEYIKNKLETSKNQKTGIGKIDSVVVTIPHNWPDPKVEATKSAVKMAGLKLQKVIREPVAAAAYWTYLNKEQGGEHNILVCDMGGGTFDVSLCRITPGKRVEVIDNISNLFAGDSVDHKIALKMSGVLGCNIPNLEEDPLGRTLLLKAEDFKKNLNGSMAEKIDNPEHIDFIGEGKEFALTPLLLKECMSELLSEGGKIISRIIGRNKGTQIDNLVLAGGMSNMLFVRKMIKEVTGLQQKNFGEETDRAISYGAALIASGKIEAHDVLMYDVGIKVRTRKEEINIILIKKGEKLPTGQFSTKSLRVGDKPFVLRTKLPAFDKKSSEIYLQVVQTVPENPDFILSEQRTKFVIPNGTPAGTTYYCNMSVDENGIVQFECKGEKAGGGGTAEFRLESVEQELIADFEEPEE